MRLWAVIAVPIALACGPALASDTANPPPSGGGRELPRVNPEAAKINQRNASVFHAGPGTPLTGSLHVPPSQVKKGEK